MPQGQYLTFVAMMSVKTPAVTPVVVKLSQADNNYAGNYHLKLNVNAQHVIGMHAIKCGIK